MIKVIIHLTLCLCIFGCAAKPLKPGANRVFLSKEKPGKNCTFIAEVTGGQGNWWTDDITSTKNLLQGSRNDIRNAAYKVKANYVHIQDKAQDTSYLGGGKIAIVGNAYKCVNQ